MVAGIAELRVGGERIDVAPEHLEQLFIADFLRIVGDLYGFGVAGVA